MKRFSAFLVLLVMILAFGLVLASCNLNGNSSGGGGGGGGLTGGGSGGYYDDDDDYYDTGGQTSSIVGTWRAYDSGEWIQIIFRSNGTLTMSYSWTYETDDGNYTVNGNTVRLTVDGDSVSGTFNGNSINFNGTVFTRY